MKKRRKSILGKILLRCIPVTVVTICLILIISIVNMNNQITEHIDTEILQITEKSSSRIQEWVGEIQYFLKTIKLTLESNVFHNDITIRRYLESTTGMHTACTTGVYAGDADGNYIDGSGWVPDADYVVTERDWYKEGLNHKDVAFGTSYVDAQTGEMVVSATCLLNISRNNMVLASDVFLSEVAKNVENMDVLGTKSGQVFVVDIANSTIISHKNHDYNGYTIKEDDENELFRNIYAMYDREDNKILKRYIKNKEYIVCKEKIEGTNWVLFTTVLSEEVHARLRSTVVVLVVITVVSILVLIAIIIQAMRSITKPIEKLTTNLSKISTGDFTIDIDGRDRNDEISAMNQAMSNYVDIMKNIIRDINGISVELKENASLSKLTADNLGATSNEESTAIKNMEANLKQFEEYIKELADSASVLIDIVNITNSMGKEANKRMNETISITDRGYNEIVNAQSIMRETVHGMEKLVDVVRKVDLSTRDIKEMMNNIEEIASQTNLLSLNASIEAARAGEAGKGFAIVADEIGRLSEDTKNTAENVSQIVKSITEEVNSMIETTSNNVRAIENNVGAIDQATITFEGIESNISKTNDAINSIVEKIKRVDEVSDTMKNITTIQSDKVEELIQSMDRISLEAQQLSIESRDVEDNSQKVQKSSQQLVEYMEFFEM